MVSIIANFSDIVSLVMNLQKRPFVAKVNFIAARLGRGLIVGRSLEIRNGQGEKEVATKGL
jgi:hypothetical protein